MKYRIVETWHGYDGFILGVVENSLGRYIAVMQGDDVVTDDPRTYKLYPISEPHTVIITEAELDKGTVKDSIPVSSGMEVVEDPEWWMKQGFCLDSKCRQSGPTHLHSKVASEMFDDTVRRTAALLAAGYTVEQLEACARLARELKDEIVQKGNSSTMSDLLKRADVFVRTKGHDPYTRIGEADELIEELSALIERIENWAGSDPASQSDDTGNAELQANWHGYTTAQEEVHAILGVKATRAETEKDHHG